MMHTCIERGDCVPCRSTDNFDDIELVRNSYQSRTRSNIALLSIAKSHRRRVLVYPYMVSDFVSSRRPRCAPDVVVDPSEPRQQVSNYCESEAEHGDAQWISA